MFHRADKKHKKTHNNLAKNPKLKKLLVISLSYLEVILVEKMFLVEVNKQPYIIMNHYKFLLIIMNHYKFLLQKIILVCRDEANKYGCSQFSAKNMQ